MADDFDAGDEVKVERKKSVAQLVYEREVEELRALLQTRGGRAFIWRLLAKCKIFRSVLIVNPLELAADAAIGNFGKSLLEEVLTADSNSYIIMQNEAIERETRNRKGE